MTRPRRITRTGRRWRILALTLTALALVAALLWLAQERARAAPVSPAHCADARTALAGCIVTPQACSPGEVASWLDRLVGACQEAPPPAYAPPARIVEPSGLTLPDPADPDALVVPVAYCPTGWEAISLLACTCLDGHVLGWWTGYGHGGCYCEGSPGGAEAVVLCEEDAS